VVAKRDEMNRRMEMNKIERTHLITSVLATLRENGAEQTCLRHVASAMLDQLFGEEPEWSIGIHNQDRWDAAICADHFISGRAGAWQAVTHLPEISA